MMSVAVYDEVGRINRLMVRKTFVDMHNKFENLLFSFCVLLSHNAIINSQLNISICRLIARHTETSACAPQFYKNYPSLQISLLVYVRVAPFAVSNSLSNDL